MERASSESNDQEQDKFVVQLVVTEEQRSVFGHYSWNYQEVGESSTAILMQDQTLPVSRYPRMVMQPNVCTFYVVLALRTKLRNNCVGRINHSLLMKETVALKEAFTGDFG